MALAALASDLSPPAKLLSPLAKLLKPFAVLLTSEEEMDLAQRVTRALDRAAVADLLGDPPKPGPG